MTQLAFKINKRSLNNKARSLRKTGQVPGIIYGEFLDKSIPVQIDNGKLTKLLTSNSKGSIIPLNVDDELRNCVVKDIQQNHCGEIIHIDFQYVKDNEVIKMKIPVKYLGQENLELKRLVLENYTPSLEFQGEVEKIPEYIEINVSQMNFEDKILAKDISIPDGITLITEPETLLAIVNA